MDYINILFKVVDIPLIIGVVFIIQTLKKYIKINNKWWSLASILAGFLIAFLKVDSISINIKQFVIQGFIYSAANEFLYQNFRTIKDLFKRKLDNEKEESKK